MTETPLPTSPLDGFYEDKFAYWLENDRRCSPHTLEAFTSDLKFFVGFCLENECLTSVAEVGHSHVRAWIVQMMEAKHRTTSVNRRLTTLKVYFKWLKKKGVYGKRDDSELREMVRFMDDEMKSSDEWKPVYQAMRNPDIGKCRREHSTTATA